MNDSLLVLLGSPREHGNSELIARKIVQGFTQMGGTAQILRAGELNIQPCTGCLKCNVTGTCRISDDGWEDFLSQFRAAKYFILATPIYFQHLPGPLKIVLDRFRSQVQIQMTPTGLIHIPRWQDSKKIAFVFSLGDRSDHDVKPALNTLTFWANLLGIRSENITVLTGYGLAIRRQVALEADRLRTLYTKLGLPENLADEDYQKNQDLLHQAYELGRAWGKSVEAES